MAYSQKEDSESLDEEDLPVEVKKKRWDADLESEKFLNERAPPLERTTSVWLERGLRMPRLGENDSTNVKVYDPTDKKSSFENMIFDPPPKYQ